MRGKVEEVLPGTFRRTQRLMQSQHYKEACELIETIRKFAPDHCELVALHCFLLTLSGNQKIAYVYAAQLLDATPYILPVLDLLTALSLTEGVQERGIYYLHKANNLISKLTIKSQQTTDSKNDMSMKKDQWVEKNNKGSDSNNSNNSSRSSGGGSGNGNNSKGLEKSNSTSMLSFSVVAKPKALQTDKDKSSLQNDTKSYGRSSGNNANESSKTTLTKKVVIQGIDYSSPDDPKQVAYTYKLKSFFNILEAEAMILIVTIIKLAEKGLTFKDLRSSSVAISSSNSILLGQISIAMANSDEFNIVHDTLKYFVIKTLSILGRNILEPVYHVEKTREDQSKISRRQQRGIKQQRFQQPPVAPFYIFRNNGQTQDHNQKPRKTRNGSIATAKQLYSNDSGNHNRTSQKNKDSSVKNSVIHSYNDIQDIGILYDFLTTNTKPWPHVPEASGTETKQGIDTSSVISLLSRAYESAPLNSNVFDQVQENISPKTEGNSNNNTRISSRINENRYNNLLIQEDEDIPRSRSGLKETYEDYHYLRRQQIRDSAHSSRASSNASSSRAKQYQENRQVPEEKTVIKTNNIQYIPPSRKAYSRSSLSSQGSRNNRVIRNIEKAYEITTNYKGTESRPGAASRRRSMSSFALKSTRAFSLSPRTQLTSLSMWRPVPPNEEPIVSSALGTGRWIVSGGNTNHYNIGSRQQQYKYPSKNNNTNNNNNTHEKIKTTGGFYHSSDNEES